MIPSPFKPWVKYLELYLFNVPKTDTYFCNHMSLTKNTFFKNLNENHLHPLYSLSYPAPIKVMISHHMQMLLLFYVCNKIYNIIFTSVS